MNEHFNKVKSYILDLGYEITHENQKEGIFVIKAEESGINDLVIGIADPIVIFEQFILSLIHIYAADD